MGGRRGKWGRTEELLAAAGFFDDLYEAGLELFD